MNANATTEFQIVAAVVVTTVGMATILGLSVRFILVPYLRETLDIARAVQTQVTKNGNASEIPTVPDRIEAVAEQVREAKLLAKSTNEAVTALSNMFDGHMDWSQREVDRIDREQRRIVRRLQSKTRKDVTGNDG